MTTTNETPLFDDDETDSGILQERIAIMQAAIYQLRQQVESLKETLAFAAQYKGIEGRPCPLCKYEDGVFIEACRMHMDMDELQKQVESLTRKLREWEDVPREEPFNKQGDYVNGTGEGLCIWLRCGVVGAIWHGVPLGENMRLQRRKEATDGDSP